MTFPDEEKELWDTPKRSVGGTSEANLSYFSDLSPHHHGNPTNATRSGSAVNGEDLRWFDEPRLNIMGVTN